MSSRREILKTIAGIPSVPFLKLLPLDVATAAHEAVKRDKAGTLRAAYVPKYFNAHEFISLQALCQAIIPPDDRFGGAVEAGAPEFIDLLTSENEDYQRRLGGGLIWLDSTCFKRYGKTLRECSPGEQKEILDLIAYRANAESDPSISPGTSFFAFLRELTVDGYFTSEIGIKYLGYIGNTFLDEFPGCPPISGS